MIRLKKYFSLLTGILFLLSTILLDASVGYAQKNQGVKDTDKNTEYYLIYYDGGEHEITINRDVKVTLTGWTDEYMSKVSGKINKADILVEVSNELNELKVSEDEVIQYRIIKSETFQVEKVTPEEFNNQITSITTNENDSFIGEVKIVDEYGTIIKNLGYSYFSHDINGNIVEITESEYQNLNSSNNPVLSEESNLSEIELNSKFTELGTQIHSMQSDNNVPSITYSSHVEKEGWQGFVSDGATSGTEGEAKRLEAIKIKLKNSPYSGGVSYRTHVQGEGWQGFVSDGATSGTEGEAKRLEAIQIKLTGEIANHYDIYYRVHAQSYGWLDWAKNGESAGTAGLAKRLEAIEIVLVKKNGNPPGSTEQPFIANPNVRYSTHVQSIGWQNFVSNGEISGTVGEGKRLEAIKISLVNAPYNGGIKYATHVEKYGWQNDVINGALSGTTGEGKRLEAIKINLYGEMDEYYDIYYRVHAQSYGWLDWAKNGELAGTAGLAKRLEAIQIVLVEKGGESPGPTNRPFVTQPIITYSTHVQTKGWLPEVSNGVTSGTIGEGKAVEAIKISLKNIPYNGGISYKTHVQGIGWTDFVTDGKISGTTGQKKRVEAIQINLTGEMAKYYDVYYRVHSQSFGWLDWAKNGQSAGTEGLAKRMEAIEIVLVEKGGKAPGSTQKPFLMAPSVVYSTHVQSYGWLENVKDGTTSGKLGENKQIEAVRISLDHPPYDGGITYSTHIQSHGWLDPVSNGQISGTTGENKRLEAIQINLTGEISKHYDVYYRTYVSTIGWLGWAKNGMKAGTQGLAKPVEALEMKLVPKNQGAAVKEADAFIEAGIYISKRYYNVTFNDALDMQMRVNPQTDIDPIAYVSKDLVDVYGSITGSVVNLRTAPNLESQSVYTAVSYGTQFIVLDDDVNGASFEGSTKWFKIKYDNRDLYVHSKLAKLDYGQAKTDLNIREEPNTESHIFATVKAGTKLTILDMGNTWHKIRYNTPSWRKASRKETAYYLNPNNFVNDPVQRYQFLDILKPVNVSEDILNDYLKGKGVLDGKGKVFIEASKYGEGMNVIYLVAHAVLETGHGNSKLATGVTYNGKTVYNMFGIGAYDSNPIENGAATAYKYGWFSVDEAIIGGAKWIYENYLMNGKNTLYKMRWNPLSMEKYREASGQYATDIGWAYKQTFDFHRIMDAIYELRPYPIYLDVPVYK